MFNQANRLLNNSPKKKLGSTLTTIMLTSKPKIIKLELKPENKRNQESTNR